MSSATLVVAGGVALMRAEESTAPLPEGDEAARLDTTGSVSPAPFATLLEYCGVDPSKVDAETDAPSEPAESEASAAPLFEVAATISGPWLMGTLDRYEVSTGAWSPGPIDDLAPIDALASVPALPGDVDAEFTIRRLGSTIVPSLPNAVAASAQRPLRRSPSTGVVVAPELADGFRYKVRTRALPSVEVIDLATQQPVAADLRRYLEAPAVPASVASSLGREGSPWTRFEAARTRLLDRHVSEGPGAVVTVPAATVERMLAGGRGSPFEMHASIALLARWAGIPARIGYGYDRGSDVNGRLVVAARDAAAVVEIFVPGTGWLPVISTPTKAACNA